MHGTFDRIEQFSNVVVAKSWGQAHRNGFHDKLLPHWPLACYQSQTQIMIHCLLKGNPGTPDLLSQEIRNIVIERERCPHILMIYQKTS